MHTSNTVVQALKNPATQISNTEFVSRISIISCGLEPSALIGKA